MLEEVIQFVQALQPYWLWPVITGAIEAVVGFFNKKRAQRHEKKWNISYWAYGTVFLFSVLIAASLAWQDLYREIKISKGQINEYAKQLASKDNRIEDLKRKNEALTGRLLDVQKPLAAPTLTIYYGSIKAHGGNLNVIVNKDGTFLLPHIRIKNSGNADADNFKIRLFMSHDVELGLSYGWERLKYSETGFRSQFYFPSGPISHKYSIGAGETWEGPQFSGRLANGVPPKISARASIYYYGQSRPTSASVTFMMRPTPDTPSSSN